jgi:uncharacterized protein
MTTRLKTFLGAGIAALTVGLSPVSAQQTYSVISAPFGTGSYVLGSALEQIANKTNSGIKISHAESPGFVFNHNQLDTKPETRKTLIIGSGRGVNAAAAAGETPFKEKASTTKLLANYNLGSYFLATLNPNIRTLQDVNGKSVALGRRPQINWAVQPEALIAAAGVKPSRVQHVGIKEAVDALLNGQVDVAVVGAYLDPINNIVQMAPQTQEFIASGRKINFIGWPKDLVEKVNASGMPMTAITLPAGSVPGHTGPLPSFSDTISWTVHPDFPEEAAYNITKLILQNVGSFKDYHALGQLMSPRALVHGWPVNEIHPGAVRAYREAGVLK